jgi:DNA repair protein RadA/Sms
MHDTDRTVPLEAPPEPELPKKYKCRGRGCTYQADEPWPGRCPGCHGFYNVVRNRRVGEDANISMAQAMTHKPRERVSTGIDELDRVLGGGMVIGSVILIGGPRGVGKTTVLMQAADGVSKSTHGGRVIYASGEQSRADILETGARIGVTNQNIDVVGAQDNDAGDIDHVIHNIASTKKPKLIIIDSIQTAYRDDCDGAAGTVAQIDAVGLYLMTYAKKENVTVIIVCHVNKMGDYAGSEKLQHYVDTLVYIAPQPIIGTSGEPIPATKKVRALSIFEKNRFGDEDVEARLVMTERGLQPLPLSVARHYAKLTLVGNDDDFDDGNL